MGKEDQRKRHYGSFWGRSSTDPDLIIGLLLFISTFIIYLRFLAPSIFTGDSADATIASFALGIPHPPGFPVYTWIGHVFTFIPIGDIAYRVNLMSAFFGALAIPVVYAIIRSSVPRVDNSILLINASRGGAIIGSLSFAFSVSYWAQAEIAEVYTLNAFIIGSMILLSLIWAESRDKRLLYYIALFSGLSLGVHASNVLFMPGFLAFLLLTDREAVLNKRTLFTMAAIFLAIGALQIIYLLVRAWQGPAYAYMDIRTMDGFWSYITAKEYSAAPFSVPLAAGFSMYVDLLAENFSLMGMAMGIIGVAFFMKRNWRQSSFFAYLFAVNVLYFSQFNSGDIADKLVPSFMIFAILMGLGIYEILDVILGPLSRVSDAQKPLDRSHLGKVILAALVLILSAVVPVTSYTAYSHDVDRSGSSDFSSFLLEALKEVPANSTILDQWGTCEPIKYFQIVHQVNPTVEVVGADPADWADRVDERIARKNVFMLEMYEELSKRYSEIPVLSTPGVGVLYKIYPGRPSFAVKDPVIQNPKNKSFDGKVELLGYNINQTAGERSFTITYFWKSPGDASRDLIVYTDLVNPDGDPVLEDVHFPIYNSYPSSGWARNEVLAESYNIFLPSTVGSGTYQMFLTGVWDQDSSGAYDRIPLKNIEVG